MLTLLSKSTWTPAIRREHALAEEAGRNGVGVLFVERPVDVRGLRAPETRGRWLRAAAGREPIRPELDGVDVLATATLLPGYRSAVSRRLEHALVGRALRGLDPDGTVVATTPWQWPLARRLPARRRVFDCADDWAALLPGRGGALGELYARVAAEADAVTVASPGLADLFPHRSVDVIRNGVSRDIYDPTPSLPSGERLLVYAGTISERFDVELVEGLLAALPGWRLELYGQCQYQGLGDAPAPELAGLLARPAVSWHGPVPRSDLVKALDRAAVLVLPHRRARVAGEGTASWRGDAMKFYDYAARGRPIVSTRWADDLGLEGPPGLRLADRPDEFEAAVAGALAEPVELAEARRLWAAERTWALRFRDWVRVVLPVAAHA